MDVIWARRSPDGASAHISVEMRGFFGVPGFRRSDARAAFDVDVGIIKKEVWPATMNLLGMLRTEPVGIDRMVENDARPNFRYTTMKHVQGEEFNFRRQVAPLLTSEWMVEPGNEEKSLFILRTMLAVAALKGRVAYFIVPSIVDENAFRWDRLNDLRLAELAARSPTNLKVFRIRRAPGTAGPMERVRGQYVALLWYRVDPLRPKKNWQWRVVSKLFGRPRDYDRLAIKHGTASVALQQGEQFEPPSHYAIGGHIGSWPYEQSIDWHGADLASYASSRSSSHGRPANHIRPAGEDVETGSWLVSRADSVEAVSISGGGSQQRGGSQQNGDGGSGRHGGNGPPTRLSVDPNWETVRRQNENAAGGQGGSQANSQQNGRGGGSHHGGNGQPTRLSVDPNWETVRRQNENAAGGQGGSQANSQQNGDGGSGRHGGNGPPTRLSVDPNWETVRRQNENAAGGQGGSQANSQPVSLATTIQASPIFDSAGSRPGSQASRRASGGSPSNAARRQQSGDSHTSIGSGYWASSSDAGTLSARQASSQPGRQANGQQRGGGGDSSASAAGNQTGGGGRSGAGGGSQDAARIWGSGVNGRHGYYYGPPPGGSHGSRHSSAADSQSSSVHRSLSGGGGAGANSQQNRGGGVGSAAAGSQAGDSSHGGSGGDSHENSRSSSARHGPSGGSGDGGGESRRYRGRNEMDTTTSDEKFLNDENDVPQDESTRSPKSSLRSEVSTLNLQPDQNFIDYGTENVDSVSTRSFHTVRSTPSSESESGSSAPPSPPISPRPLAAAPRPPPARGGFRRYRWQPQRRPPAAAPHPPPVRWRGGFRRERRQPQRSQPAAAPLPAKPPGAGPSRAPSSSSSSSSLSDSPREKIVLDISDDDEEEEDDSHLDHLSWDDAPDARKKLFSDLLRELHETLKRTERIKTPRDSPESEQQRTLMEHLKETIREYEEVIEENHTREESKDIIDNAKRGATKRRHEDEDWNQVQIKTRKVIQEKQNALDVLRRKNVYRKRPRPSSSRARSAQYRILLRRTRDLQEALDKARHDIAEDRRKHDEERAQARQQQPPVVTVNPQQNAGSDPWAVSRPQPPAAAQQQSAGGGDGDGVKPNTETRKTSEGSDDDDNRLALELEEEVADSDDSILTRRKTIPKKEGTFLTDHQGRHAKGPTRPDGDDLTAGVIPKQLQAVANPPKPDQLKPLGQESPRSDTKNRKPDKKRRPANPSSESRSSVDLSRAPSAASAPRGDDVEELSAAVQSPRGQPPAARRPRSGVVGGDMSDSDQHPSSDSDAPAARGPPRRFGQRQAPQTTRSDGQAWGWQPSKTLVVGSENHGNSSQRTHAVPPDSPSSDDSGRRQPIVLRPEWEYKGTQKQSLSRSSSSSSNAGQRSEHQSIYTNPVPPPPEKRKFPRKTERPGRVMSEIDVATVVRRQQERENTKKLTELVHRITGEIRDIEGLQQTQQILRNHVDALLKYSQIRGFGLARDVQHLLNVMLLFQKVPTNQGRQILGKVRDRHNLSSSPTDLANELVDRAREFYEQQDATHARRPRTVSVSERAKGDAEVLKELVGRLTEAKSRAEIRRMSQEALTKLRALNSESIQEEKNIVTRAIQIVTQEQDAEATLLAVQELVKPSGSNNTILTLLARIKDALRADAEKERKRRAQESRENKRRAKREKEDEQRRRRVGKEREVHAARMLKSRQTSSAIDQHLESGKSPRHALSKLQPVPLPSPRRAASASSLSPRNRASRRASSKASSRASSSASHHPLSYDSEIEPDALDTAGIFTVD